MHHLCTCTIYTHTSGFHTGFFLREGKLCHWPKERTVQCQIRSSLGQWCTISLSKTLMYMYTCSCIHRYPNEHFLSKPLSLTMLVAIPVLHIVKQCTCSQPPYQEEQWVQSWTGSCLQQLSYLPFQYLCLLVSSLKSTL